MELLFGETSGLVEAVPDALVTGRIKKLNTIIDKLNRPHTPSKLATMYDIAGCRAVVNTMEELDMVCSIMCAKATCDLDKTCKHDYVSRPKKSGYRGRHLIFVFECIPGLNLFAELQLRTALQHS